MSAEVPRNILDVELSKRNYGEAFSEALLQHLKPAHALASAPDVKKYHKQFLGNYRDVCHQNFSRIFLRTHLDLIGVLFILRTNRSSKSSIKEDIRRIRVDTIDVPFDQEEKMLETALDLVSGLWTMTAVSHRASVHQGLNFSEVAWLDDDMLSDAIKRSFQPKPLRRHVSFERQFNAANLDKYTGLKIYWTNDLKDHLRLKNDNRTVSIFHHASILRQHQAQWRPSTTYQDELIAEALATLALLIPEYDEKVSRWYYQTSKRHKLDPEAGNCGELAELGRSTRSLPICGHRLLALKKAFDASVQQSLWQKLRDPTRGRKAWYETWVGILGLMFAILYGLIQCIEGALQVYKAYHPS